MRTSNTGTGGIGNPRVRTKEGRTAAYGVDGGLEVLGGAVGGEDEEEGSREDVRVGGVAPTAGRRRGYERRGGLLVFAVGVHGCGQRGQRAWGARVECAVK